MQILKGGGCRNGWGAPPRGGGLAPRTADLSACSAVVIKQTKAHKLAPTVGCPQLFQTPTRAPHPPGPPAGGSAVLLVLQPGWGFDTGNTCDPRPGSPGYLARKEAIRCRFKHSVVSIPTGLPRLFRREYSGALGNSP